MTKYLNKNNMKHKIKNEKNEKNEKVNKYFDDSSEFNDVFLFLQ